jgi:hypothetical protein
MQARNYTGEQFQMLYLINEHLRALQCGSELSFNESNGEFLYDSEAPDTPEHSKAVMFGIAEANDIIIPDNLNKRSDIAKTLENALSKLKLLEINKMSEQEAQVKALIVDGIAADKTDDQILVSIVNAGVSFKNAGRLFKQITEGEGLRISNKTRLEQGFAILKRARFKAAKEYSKVEEMIALILDEETGVKDTDRVQAVRIIRRYAKEAEIVLPKAPKQAGTKSMTAIQNWMVENHGATEEEFRTYMLGIGKRDNVIAKNWKWFEVARRIATAINSPEAETE